MTRTEPIATGSESPYRSAFERFETETAARHPSWLQALRRPAFAHFTELGFPSVHDEEWRFTPIAPIEQLPFRPAPGLSLGGLTRQGIERFRFGGVPCHTLVFVNGHHAAALSEATALPVGAQVLSLASVWETEPTIQKHLGQYARSDENAFTALNTAFFADGAFVHLGRGTVLERPIHLLFISTAGDASLTSHPRSLIVAERESKATIVESHVTVADGSYCTNAVTELVLGEGAHIEHGKVQSESRSAFYVATVQAHQDRSSTLLNHSIALGGRLARNDVRSKLAGEGISCVLNGLYMAGGEQLIDHHTVIDHAKPHCESHEYYNGILDGRSRGVFNGKIFVRKDAQKTDARQTSRALLLSDDATIDSKPQLEIFADDVRCTHGATVGQLDDDAIFYLRARGIGKEQARAMLVRAFAGEIIDRISIPSVRAELDEVVTRQLAPGDRS